uniref:Probable protein E5 n=1 Tax=Human papillomavirus 52 TaxID=10618 RepID=F8S505_HPV52|nr:early protein E5 [human papillomavirus 52]AEI61523.1 early protein E5 [human papillomavirus 52]
MLGLFVFCFILLMVLCAVLRPLLLSISVYAQVLVLVLLLWVSIGSPFKVFCFYLLFLYFPMFCIHCHAQYLAQLQ